MPLSAGSDDAVCSNAGAHHRRTRGIGRPLTSSNRWAKRVRKGSLRARSDRRIRIGHAALLRDEYLAHVEKHQCPALECNALVDVKIDHANVSNAVCIKTCPVGAISDDFVVTPPIAPAATSCIEVCPKRASAA